MDKTILKLIVLLKENLYSGWNEESLDFFHLAEKNGYGINHEYFSYEVIN